MEFRIYTTVHGLPVEHEAAWEPLVERLEREHPELGPIIGWSEGDAQIVLATEAADPAEASRTAMQLVTDALRSCGLGHLYAAEFDVEPADETPVAVL